MHVKVSLIALAACALFSCLGGKAYAAPLKIRQGWAVPTATFSPMIFAEAEMLGPNVLRHYGKSYIVEPEHFSGTSTELTAIATGEIDIVTISYSTLPFAVENAHLEDLRVVADGEQDGVGDYFSSPFLVRKDSKISTPEDLKGKTIAVNVIGDAVGIAARAMLRKHGLAANDYTVVEAPFPALGAMLLQRKVDLVADVPPFIYEPTLAAGTRALFTMKDAVGPSQLIVLAARTAFLKTHRAALDDFFEDLLRGTRWMEDPANRTKAVALAARFAKVPPERLSYYLTKKDRYRDPNCLPNIEALQHNIDVERKLGFLKSPFDVQKYVDLAFVRRAAERLH